MPIAATKVGPMVTGDARSAQQPRNEANEMKDAEEQVCYIYGSPGQGTYSTIGCNLSYDHVNFIYLSSLRFLHI